MSMHTALKKLKVVQNTEGNENINNYALYISRIITVVTKSKMLPHSKGQGMARVNTISYISRLLL